MTPLTLINSREVNELADRDELLAALAAGFRALSAGDGVVAPPRGELVVPGAGLLLTMPAFAPGLPLGVKLVTIFPNNVERQIPTHLATISLLDAETGRTVALMDGTEVTALRTAGAAALAARLVARPDARILTILGAGVQGRRHLEFMAAEFDFDTIYVASRRPEDAQRLASAHPRAEAIGRYKDAVRRADIVCLCSDATEPLFPGDWVRDGQHVSSVGYAPPGYELDPALAANHRLFVESRVAFDPPPAGCAELAGLDPDDGTELGEVLLGKRPGRRARDEITVYKAMGHAIEDLVVANMVYARAKTRSKGRRIEL